MSTDNPQTLTIPSTQGNTPVPPKPLEERKTLRQWLEEDNPPEHLVSEICPMRSLVALGCTINKLDPGTANYKDKLTYSELVTLMESARAFHLEMIGKLGLAEHQAPIIPADGMLFAMIIKKPEGAQVMKINDSIMSAAVAQDREGVKSSMMGVMLSSCTLYPDVTHRHAVFKDYGGLSQEFANKCMMLGRQSVDEIVGKR
jgi:hypothetical protein